MISRALAIWLLLALLANLIGGMKVAFVYPRVGEYAGQIIGTLVFCPVIFAVTRSRIRWMNPRSVRDAILIGIFWVILTVAFEFLAGHYLFGNSWEKLFSSYKFWQGNLWILVLLTLAISPALAARTRMWRGRYRQAA